MINQKYPNAYLEDELLNLKRDLQICHKKDKGLIIGRIIRFDQVYFFKFVGCVLVGVHSITYTRSLTAITVWDDEDQTNDMQLS